MPHTLESQPQTRGLGLLGPSVPPHDPLWPRATNPWRKLPGAVPGSLSKKGDHSGEITPQGDGTGRDPSLQRIPLLYLTVHGLKVKIWIFGRCLSLHVQVPSASFRAGGLFGTDIIPLNPTPFLVTVGTLQLPDSWYLFLPA